MQISDLCFFCVRVCCGLPISHPSGQFVHSLFHFPVYTEFNCRGWADTSKSVRGLLLVCMMSFPYFFCDTGSSVIAFSVANCQSTGKLALLFPWWTLTQRATFGPVHLLGYNINRAVNTNNSQRVKRQVSCADWQPAKLLGRLVLVSCAQAPMHQYLLSATFKALKHTVWMISTVLSTRVLLLWVD